MKKKGTKAKASKRGDSQPSMPISLLKLILSEAEAKEGKGKKKSQSVKRGKTFKFGKRSSDVSGILGRKASKQTGTSKQHSSSRAGGTSISGTERSSMRDDDEDSEEEETGTKRKTTTKRSGMSS